MPQRAGSDPVAEGRLDDKIEVVWGDAPRMPIDDGGRLALFEVVSGPAEAISGTGALGDCARGELLASSDCDEGGPPRWHAPAC